MDVRTMFDSEYLGAWDLNGRDVNVVISHAKAGELTGQGGKKSKKPIVFFQGKQKGMALNKTNMKIIANLYGYDTTRWKGCAITIYPTRTSFGGVEMDCIRVRPSAPQARNNVRRPPAPPSEEQPIDPDAEVNVDPEGDIQDHAEEDAARAAAIDAGAEG